MTCPHWPAQGEKQEAETKLGSQRGHPSREGDLNAAEESHKQRGGTSSAPGQWKDWARGIYPKIPESFINLGLNSEKLV